jgi:hypothetical protein
MTAQRVTGIDAPAWPDTRPRVEPPLRVRGFVARHGRGLVLAVVLVIAILVVAWWGIVVGTTTTVSIPTGQGQFPSDPNAVDPAHPVFTYQCSPEPTGIGIGPGVDLARRDGLLLPPGHRLRINRGWFRVPQFTYVANDGSTYALERGPWVAASCP